MEDYQIVNLYWARSEEAIDQTSKKYGKMLHRISFSMLASTEDADECVNDTYMTAWGKMPKERPVYLGAFLARIVRFISVDRFRRQHREKRGGMGGIIEELTECIPDTSTVEQELENGRLAETLNRFISALDEEKRTIFVQRYFYSSPVSYIASSMNISEGKVKSVLFRARASLKEVLRREELL